MSKKVLLVLLLLIFASCASAQDRTVSPAAPSKGQWVFALEDSLPLYEDPNPKADVEYVELPEAWLKVVSTVRDAENNLWRVLEYNVLLPLVFLDSIITPPVKSLLISCL